MTPRIAMAGLSAVSLGVAIVIASLVQGSATPAFADSSPYMLYCPGTPVGNIALNNVVTTGTITPAAPESGSTFNLTNYQSTVALPSSIVSAAAALGNSAITGSATLKVDATGATPASLAAPPITIDAPIPSPVPATGLTLTLPSTPGTIGPFTASGGVISLTVDPAVALSLDVSGSTLTLTCTPYPNNSAMTGIVPSAPTAPKASPVIATSTTGGGTTTTTVPVSSTTTTPPATLTGAYELYCPGTPVGTVVLNDAMTSATLSPTEPTAGEPFSVTGYQTVVNLPAALAGAAAALSPTLTGSATTQIDAIGATPATTPQGPFTFNVTIPSPVPDDGVPLSLPDSPSTISGFTATGGAITIQQDSNAGLSLTVAGSALTLTCQSYPNDSVVPSGITTDSPDVSSIDPVIASASGGATSTTTTGGPTSTTTTPEASSSTTAPVSATSSTSSPTAAATSTSTSPVTSSTSPSSTTHPTTPPTTQPPSTGGSGGSSTTQAVTTSPSSLAFTGPGPGLKTATLLGAALILLGLLTLALVDTPRRMIYQLACFAAGGRGNRSDGAIRSGARGSTIAPKFGASADWYGDPLGVGLRYWDGKQWTEHVAYQDHDSAWTRPQPDDREG